MFYPINRQKLKEISSTFTEDKEKPQIFTFEELEPGNFFILVLTLLKQLINYQNSWRLILHRLTNLLINYWFQL